MRSTVFNPSAIPDSPRTSRRPAGRSRSSRSPVATPRHLTRVQFDHYGSPDVLRVVDVPRPSAGDGQVLVQVAAAGNNPGEIAIRNGAMEQMFPATFPSGQGSDFVGRVVEIGPGVTEFAPGDEVMGWSDRRSAQADHLVSGRQHLIAKPRALDWIRAGALWAIGVTSFSAVRAVAVQPGEVVAVSAAAGRGARQWARPIARGGARCSRARR